MSEKRRHARVAHRDVVRFDAAGTQVEGVSVDISSTGIQVAVAVPQSFDRVEMVRFSLPDMGAELELPVRLARTENDSASDGRCTLAFEFLRGADQQIRLIENYIRDSKAREAATGEAGSEVRRVPRLDCAIPASSDSPLGDIVVNNLSPAGLLVSAVGDVTSGAVLPISFTLPGRERPLKTRCQVAYVVSDPTNARVRFGARFIDLAQVLRARITNYIEEAAASQSLHSVQSTLEAENNNGHWLEGPRLTAALAEAHESIFYVLFDEGRAIFHASLVSETKGGESGELVFQFDSEPEVTKGQAVFLSFAARGSNHYFSSRVVSASREGDGKRTLLRIAYPARIHETDNRSSGRKRVFEGREIVLFPDGTEFGAKGVRGNLIDISWRGFLCEILEADNSPAQILPGSAVTYLVDPRFKLMTHGRVRHVSPARSTDRGRVVQIGVEAGVRRGQVGIRRIPLQEWEAQVRSRLTNPENRAPRCVSRRATYRNRRGQEIVALVNHIGHGDDPTVVIIPPAFGKKKETLAPLAATLCANFAHAGMPIVVIRYDGINRPGESYNHADRPARGYEMLHYRPSQGVEDIRTTLDYVYQNEDFRPANVILVTSSMSSVDARKLLLTEKARVSAWVSLMGVAAARTTLMNVLAGTDIVTNHKLNIQNGVRGMLGHLVDMDVLARDLLEQKYAFVTDARFDLARIDLPILWIVGEHDHWVDGAEVVDIMSVESGARREIVYLPTGHNLRSSDDAAETFCMIAEFCAKTAGVEIVATTPAKDAVLAMISREREAIFQPLDSAEVSAYWHSYLLGDRHDSEGYDFYSNLAAFRLFMETEAELLDPRPGQTIADMGCGTGLLTREILRKLARADQTGQSLPDTEVVAVDLVPEALKRTEEKCRAVLADTSGPDGVSVRFEVQNLEPNRLLPLRDFIDHPELPVEFLKGRIEGLAERIVERWQRDGDARLAGYLRGSAGIPPVALEDKAVAREMNRASRFLLGALVVGDLQNAPPTLLDNAPIPSSRYRADDLLFEHLSFGSCNPPDRGVTKAARYDSIAASLFVSYIINPDYLLAEFHRLIKPGGRLLVSSMRPDSDVSTIFTDYVDEVSTNSAHAGQLAAAREMLNEAAALFELEEEGYFRFFTEDELRTLLESAGFRDIKVIRSLGAPPQAFIATAVAVGDPQEPWSRYV